MAVLCEAISVVIRRDAIDEFHDGGWDQFLTAVPNKTLCTDGELARVGFLTPDDVKKFVDALEENGLQFEPKSKSFGLFRSRRNRSDIVIVDQYRGPTTSCLWIEFGKFNLSGEDTEISMCWLYEGDRIASEIHINDKNMQLATPQGWSPADHYSLKFIDE